MVTAMSQEIIDINSLNDWLKKQTKKKTSTSRWKSLHFLCLLRGWPGEEKMTAFDKEIRFEINYMQCDLETMSVSGLAVNEGNKNLENDLNHSCNL